MSHTLFQLFNSYYYGLLIYKGKRLILFTMMIKVRREDNTSELLFWSKKHLLIKKYNSKINIFTSEILLYNKINIYLWTIILH